MAALARKAWLVALCRAVLVAIFVYASISKILDPPGFAKLVYEYHLLPSELVNAWAAYLPWFELIAGLGLLLGPLRRGAAGLTAVLLVVFLAAVGVNIARGIPFECGCGGAHDGFVIPLVSPVMDFVLSSPSPWVTFARDVVLLGMTALVWKGDQPGSARQ